MYSFIELKTLGVLPSIDDYDRELVLRYYLDNEYDLNTGKRCKLAWKVKEYSNFWRYYVQHNQDSKRYTELKQRTINLVGERGFYDMLNFTRLLFETAYLRKMGCIDILSETFLVDMWSIHNREIWFNPENIFNRCRS